jgi:hypothetical protein
MSTSPSSNQHPRFGFNEVRPWAGELSDTALAGDSFPRTSGLFDLCLVVDFELTAGSGEVNVGLEGSNDGVNWVGLGSFPATEYFTASGQNSLDVDCERWTYLRVRAVVVSGAPTFTMDVWTVGIQGDSEKFLRTTDVSRDGNTENAGTVNIRPRGTKFVNVQVISTGVVLDGVTSYDVVLQGSPNYEQDDPGSAVWVDLNSVSVTGDGQEIMVDGLSKLIDLQCYNWFRFLVRDNGAAGASSDYTMEILLSMDSGDWVLVTTGAADEGGGSDITPALLEVLFGTPGAEAADTIQVPFTVVDGEGNPVTTAKRVEFLVYDTTQAGELDLAANATFSAVGGGASAVAGLTTNRVLVITDASGIGTLDVLDAAAETVYVTGTQPSAPLPTQQLVWKAAEAALTFA